MILNISLKAGEAKKRIQIEILMQNFINTKDIYVF